MSEEIKEQEYYPENPWLAVGPVLLAVFIDFDGHKDDENIKLLLKDLAQNCKSIRVIGSYTHF